MQVETVLLIALAVFVALALVLWQYSRIRRPRPGYALYLMACRFIAWFGLMLLLINPTFIKEQPYLEKSRLVLLADNSASISHLELDTDLNRVLNELLENQEVREKYDVRTLSFDRGINVSDSLQFNKSATDIHQALRTIERTMGNQRAAIVLLSDGNQTIGADYEFTNMVNRHSVYPLVLGDTTKYEDLVIDRINANRYAFLNNRYPIEILVRYQGDSQIDAILDVKVNGSVRSRERFQMNRNENAKRIEVLLQADSPGLKLINVELQPLENERNKVNNVQQLAVEVIDEKSKVMIVSDLVHPDVGTLKKAIESNEQREVVVLRPTADPSLYEEADVFILYQPNRSFEALYTFLGNRNVNYLTVTGPETDWTFLNNIQQKYQKNSFNQDEDVSPVLNSGFTLFDIGEFTTENFPPLKTTLGDLLVTSAYESLVGQRIKGVEMDDPLWIFIENGNQREAAIFGEGIWKWRVQAFREDASFAAFDNLISKMLLFLDSENRLERFNLDYDNIFREAQFASIRATYFNQAYEFESNANIRLKIQDPEGENALEIPMLLKGNYYEADLSSLSPGTYQFTASVVDQNESRSGRFTILDFDVEKQFLSSEFNKLDRLANQSGGKSYLPSQSGALIDDLLAEERFRPTQKSQQNIVSLIDFKILLAIVIGAFTAEWFIRKYNGLI